VTAHHEASPLSSTCSKKGNTEFVFHCHSQSTSWVKIHFLLTKVPRISRQ
jgi:hypothetical protein